MISSKLTNYIENVDKSLSPFISMLMLFAVMDVQCRTDLFLSNKVFDSNSYKVCMELWLVMFVFLKNETIFHSSVSVFIVWYILQSQYQSWAISEFGIVLIICPAQFL